MEIRTKFKIGYKIYYIEYTSSKCDDCNDLGCDDCDREPSEIFKSYRPKEGIIKVIQEYAIITTDNRYIHKQNCFATEEEAQVECRRRNGKGGK